MSKKNKHSQNGQQTASASMEHATEYRIIKHDLIKVVALNVVYLAAIITLYYTNLKSGYLDTWFSHLLHF